MGAVAFGQIAEGESSRQAWERLVQESEYRSGHDQYNGTCSTCQLGNTIQLAEVYSPAVEKQAHAYVKADNNGRKYTATCLDLGRVGYRVATATKKAVKHDIAAKYVVQYVVVSDFWNVVSSHATKAEAEEAAIALALHNPDKYYEVCKRPVNVNKMKDNVTEIDVTVALKKTRPKNIKPNMCVTEIHKYMFYGLAAE